MPAKDAAYRLIPNRRVHGVSSLAQRLVYSDDELMVSLSNSLQLREQEIADRNTPYGWLKALALGRDDGRTIEIDGMRLQQLLNMTGESPRERIDLNGFYDVNLAYFRDLLKQARKLTAHAKQGDN